MYTEQRNNSQVESVIDKVEDLIKKCMAVYLSHDEAVNALKVQFDVDPIITDGVWRKMAEQNKEYFEAYNLMLIVKDQITRFNNLLEMQLQLTCGSHVPPLNCESDLYTSFQPELVVNKNGSPDTLFRADVSGNTPLYQHSNWPGFGYAGNTHPPANGMVQSTMPSSHLPLNGMVQTPMPSSHLPTNGIIQTPLPSSECVNVPEEIFRELNLAAEWGINYGDKHSLESVLDNGFNQDDFGSE